MATPSFVTPPTHNTQAPPPPILPEAQRALEQYAQLDPTKVIVRFKATGNAPVLQNTYAKITAGQKFQAVIKYLKTQLGFSPSDSLFLYINSSFSPNPDDTVIGLYKSFQVDKQLIVNYSTTVAWG